MKLALHWFRCDLRLTDNVALQAATRTAKAVVPIFIFDPKILTSRDVSANQVGLMLQDLQALESGVAAAGGRLIFRHGQILDEMADLLRETGADGLFYNRDYEPYARERDAAVEKLARSQGVEVMSFKDSVLQEPGEVLKEDGKPYTVFTPYKRRWRLVPAPAALPKARFPAAPGLKSPRSVPFPTAQQLGFAVKIPLPEGGEKAAQKRLKDFTAGDLLHYAEGRNVPATGSTSRLSPHLRLGTLSVRTVLATVEKAAQDHPEARASIDTYVGELIWRDFYKQILWHFPHVAQGSFRPAYDKLAWRNDDRLFAAWCEGRTGYPLVDAGMRQLNATGWMHNRLRMVTATFLSKDLLISWQWGERYFMQRLLDGDLAANNGGWQWSAGTGTDAQPWFRIFNPLAQAKKFDPEGEFIRRYVPEVETRDYPAPIVDHAQQRLKTLAAFRAVRTK